MQTHTNAKQIISDGDVLKIKAKSSGNSADRAWWSLVHEREWMKRCTISPRRVTRKINSCRGQVQHSKLKMNTSCPNLCMHAFYTHMHSSEGMETSLNLAEHRKKCWFNLNVMNSIRESLNILYLVPTVAWNGENLPTPKKWVKRASTWKWF